MEMYRSIQSVYFFFIIILNCIQELRVVIQHREGKSPCLCGLVKGCNVNFKVPEVVINAISERLDTTNLLPDRNRKLMD